MNKDIQQKDGVCSPIGTLFDIERFCTRDGPGIRTTVFLKGCPLHCAWCHNPEGLSRQKTISFAAEKCILCGDCAAACEHGAHQLVVAGDGQHGTHRFDRGKCHLCGTCIQACPTGALEIVGHDVTVDEVMRDVLQDRVFYSRSGGGLTISGGEPTVQIDFTEALLKSARKEGLHCCIETCGFSSWTNLERLLPLVDLFLYDYKESDPQRHLNFVGQSCEVISDNLKKLHDRRAAIQLQCPIVPGYNDREEHLQAIVATAKALPRLLGVALLPYHPLGTVKLQRLGLPDRVNQLTATEPGKLLQQWTQILEKHGVRVMS